jgi:FkbH-like protein
MTLNEALRLVNSSRENRAKEAPVVLLSGFQPLHIETFLQAHALERLAGERIDVTTGLFGDLRGNIRKAAESKATTAALFLEWDDLDPRLGLRSSGGWANAVRHDIESTCQAALRDFAELIGQLATNAVVAVSGPSLPLVPLGHTVQLQATSFELGLQRQVAAFLQQLASIPGVRVLDPAWLSSASPMASRLDPKMFLVAGFPYSAKHADILAAGMIELLYPASPKKGLIVDLDDTLWSGIVGEVGADGVSWSLERHTQGHALLQQMLSLLAENGVLLAIASKNELTTVERALARPDLLVSRDAFFPVLASWGPKSAAVQQILGAWNIHADSVVFLDDNPMELSEVQTAHPAIETLQFRPKDPAAVWDLLSRLRNLFGKPAVLAEDRLRAASIRSGVEYQRAGVAADGDFLPTLSGRVTINYHKDPADKRPLELINKTNQFNLNGKRVAEGDWLARLQSNDAIAATISYEDKFGALGKIAALLGVRQGPDIRITSWVMSCRAFSRKIEHHTLDSLFRVCQATRLSFDYSATDRNQPLQQFFQEMGIDAAAAGGPWLSRESFAVAPRQLPHQVTEKSS